MHNQFRNGFMTQTVSIRIFLRLSIWAVGKVVFLFFGLLFGRAYKMVASCPLRWNRIKTVSKAGRAEAWRQRQSSIITVGSLKLVVPKDSAWVHCFCELKIH